MQLIKFAILLTFVLPLTGQEIHQCKDYFRTIGAEDHMHTGLATLPPNPLTKNFDLKFHRLELTVDPSVSFIKGTVTSYFVVLENDLDAIHFDLADNMVIKSIIYHGSNILSSRPGNDVLKIVLPNKISTGILDSISVEYEGAPISTGFGSFIQSTHAGIPILWTLSEPYGAKSWWPCKQDLNDKIDSMDIWVKSPIQYRTASNGLLIGEETLGSDIICKWKHRYPIPAYLVAIAVSNYAQYTEQVKLESGKTLNILNYVFPENLDEAKSQTKELLEVIQLYNRLLGDYPFPDEKYGHAQFGWGGGMEHQTMSFVSGFSYELLAHELAHQWFGDKVTCGNWEDIWLHEGFATYLSGLCYQFLRPEWWPRFLSQRLNSVVSQPGGSVWVNDISNVGRIFNGRLSYAKGAMVLHMIRWKIGDEAFFTALKNYLKDPDHAYNYALTTDLKYFFEMSSGINLDEFFGDWFYREGFPSYQILWNNTSSGILHFKIDQSSSHPSNDFFELPLPIKVFGEGKDTMLRLEHRFNGEEFDISLPYKVDSIQFDPHISIISANNIIKQITTGTKDDIFEKNCQISPNPFSEVLFIKLKENLIHNPVHFEISNSLGETFSTGKIMDSFTEINTKSWSPGIFYFKIITGNVQIIEKIVKK